MSKNTKKKLMEVIVKTGLIISLILAISYIVIGIR